MTQHFATACPYLEEDDPERVGPVGWLAICPCDWRGPVRATVRSANRDATLHNRKSRTGPDEVTVGP